MRSLIILFITICSIISCNYQEKVERHSSSSARANEHVTTEDKEERPIEYWQTQRKGANYFNEKPTREWFESAAKANIKLVRFTYEKWASSHTDFLLGNADNYTELIEEDLIKLIKFLDIAHELGIKVVLTPLSLPGARYSQSNKGKKDGRLWTDEKFLTQAIQFWTDLATRLKRHPAIVGYNLINEPFPELFHGKTTFWGGNFKEWYTNIEGGPGDLNRFNLKMTEAIRKIDTVTPIIIESGLYATPWAFEYLEPIKDDKVIYSFHMYEPYEYTTKRLNKGAFKYPGNIKVEDPGGIFEMNKSNLNRFLSPVTNWTKRHNIPTNRIWVGEFGCDRTMPGANQYLSDLVDIFNTNKWHWTFYSFREDNWTSMDYELGNMKVNWKYWDYEKEGTLHEHYDEIYTGTKKNELWTLLQSEFSQ